MDIFPCTPKCRLWPSLWFQYALLLNSILPSLVTFDPLAVAASSVPLPANETDKLSLLAFRDGVAGGPAGALSSWNDSLHYCRWRGVTCGRRHPQRVIALDLRSRSLRGHVSPSIANLTFLREIDLSDNQLNGVIPRQVGALLRLRYLNLSHNNLAGDIPTNLTRCSQLRVLHLENNHLAGEIPMALGNLPKLIRFYLHSNQISGAIPPSLGNLSSDVFGVLSLGDNALTGAIPSELGRLKSLRGFGVGENRLSGMVPPSLYNLSDLSVLEIINNQLSGTLPPHIGTALPKLAYLGVGGNRFQGNIPRSLTNASSLQVIDIADNMFTGTIPGNLGILKELWELNAARNRLEAREPKDWEFLSSLAANCTGLINIAIFLNELRGPLPDSIANFSTSLQKLMIGGNPISGSIPMGIGNLVGLTDLDMKKAKFRGLIPSTLGKLNNLVTLDLGENQLSGEIPIELGNLTLLNELYLQRNHLSGHVPRSFGRYQQLRELYIFFNSLNGSIPEELFTDLLTLAHVDLSNNFLEGPLPPSVGQLVNVQRLDLSVNKLSGHLPDTLGNCRKIEQLVLYNNSFEGTIPPSLRNSKGIEYMDVSRNNLSGRIPEFLEDLKVLQYLDLSFNNFTGEVPKKGVFANASAVSLLGNTMICGGVSELHLPTCISTVDKKGGSSHSRMLVVSIVIGGFCLLLCLCLLTYFCWTRKTKGKSLAVSSFAVKTHRRISYHNLVKATDGFSNNNLIGKGSFGSVYKGVLDGEKIVAVKVLNVQRQGALKSFKYECEVLRNVRHRNLVKILSVCSSVDFSGNDFKALVFEFFPNGSLDKWLHPEPREETRTLSFAQRLRMATDVVSALDYLHNHGNSPIIHCDLKPSNILVDGDMTAHVGDFGLARFIPETPSTENHANQSSTIGIKGSIGYIAPEYGFGSPISTSGDVYSFGILLLELFTAKGPTDDRFNDGLSLQKFVEAALTDGAMNIIDPHLIPLSNEAEPLQIAENNGDSLRMRECFVSLMRIGLNCCKESPQERMTTGDVVKELHLIQEAFLGVAMPITS